VVSSSGVARPSTRRNAARSSGASGRPLPKRGTAVRGARVSHPRRPATESAGGNWDEEVALFVATWQRRRSIGLRWARGLRYLLGRIPKLLSETEGLPVPLRSGDVTEEHVAALRDRPLWQRGTTQFYFAALRQFLRWRGNPVADQPELWRLPPSVSQRRRWITREQLVRLFRAADAPARLLIALEGFNGLRRVEVLRLRASDVNLVEGWLNVRGKGRMGGKWRQIPLSEVARRELKHHLEGLRPLDPILPYSASWADQKLAAAVSRACLGDRGFRVSHHDLRRTFGRIAHSSGMDLVQLKNLLGHASLEMSVHYIGLDLERMRQGLTQVDRSIAPLLQKQGKMSASTRATLTASDAGRRASGVHRLPMP
jgi:integrase